MKNILLVVIIAMTFIGCAPNYNIEPKYDKISESIHIDTLTIDNVRQTKDTITLLHNRRVTRKNTNFLINSDKCTKIRFTGLSSSQNTYFNDSLKEQLLERFTLNENGNCNVTKIANIEFYKCGENDLDRLYNSSYYMGTETINEYGTDGINIINIDENCFQTILNHFKEKAKEDNVKIVRHLLRKDKSIPFKKEDFAGKKHRQELDKYKFNKTTKLHDKTNTIYNEEGFNINGIHKITKTRYDLNGWDIDGESKKD